MPNADLIELIQEQWARERPDLASGGFGVVGRLLLLGKLLERRVSRVLAPADRCTGPTILDAQERACSPSNRAGWELRWTADGHDRRSDAALPAAGQGHLALH